MKEKIEALLREYLKDSIKVKIVSYFILIKLFGALLNDISIIPRMLVSCFNYVSLILGFLSIIALYPDDYKLDTKIQKRCYLLILFIAIASWVVNYKTQDSYGIKKIVYMIYNYYIVYISYRYLVKKTNGEFTKKLITLFVGFIFTITLISIIMWFSNISILLFIEDRIRSVGIRFVMANSKLLYLLLYGIFRDPNIGCTTVTISLLLSVYLFNKNKANFSYKTKLFLIINVIVSLVYIILSNSRGNLLALLLVTVIWLLYILSRKNLSTANKIVSGSLLIIIVPILIYAGINFSRDVLTKAINPYNTKFISIRFIEEFEDISEYNIRDRIKVGNWMEAREKYDSYNESDKEENYEEVQSKKDEKFVKALQNSKEEKNIDVLQNSKKVDVSGLGNGRLDIWAEGIKLSKDKFLLGYGSTNLNNISKYLDDDSMLAKGYLLDNAYLEILLSYGIVALLLYIYFIAHSILTPIIRQIKIGDINEGLIFSISVLIYLGVTAFFYSDYLIGNIPAVLLINLSLYHVNNEKKELLEE